MQIAVGLGAKRTRKNLLPLMMILRAFMSSSTWSMSMCSVWPGASFLSVGSITVLSLMRSAA